jgi:hypothetical protein
MTTHDHLAPRLKKSRAMYLLPWVFVACSRVTFTFIYGELSISKAEEWESLFNEDLNEVDYKDRLPRYLLV